MKDYVWLKHILEKENEASMDIDCRGSSPAPVTEKQKAIIRAAVELFSEKGYAATSTREIARRAGVAEGTIFKQYPTKKDLMLWITGRIIHSALFPFISNGVSELLEKSYASREEFLAAFIQNRMGLMQEGVPLFKIIFQEMPFQPEIRAMLIKEMKKLPLAAIAEKLRMGEGSCPRENNFSEEELIPILLTCVSGFFILRNIIVPELFPKSRLKKDAAALVRFMARGLAGGAS